MRVTQAASWSTEDDVLASEQRFRMEDESLEDRSVEVLQIPDGVDDDLLWLYFENRRRSEGGNIISLDRRGDTAVLVFENAEAATRVVQKGSHTLSDAKLIVRKRPPKDHGKLVLRGLSLSTSRDMLELYVENLTGIESDNYTLYLSPGKDLVLIHLHQPVAEDFEKMCSRVSRRALDGARLTLEQVECTDSIMVENLPPDLADDLLKLYFESSRSGGGEVMAVSRISQRLAKVSFKDVQSVNSVLQKPHKLEETDLIVKPYYSFLHSDEGASQTSLQNGTDQGVDDQVGAVSPPNDTHSDLISGASSSSSSSSHSQEAAAPKPDLQVTPEPVNISKNTSQVLQPPPEQQPFVCHISVPDSTKREIVALSELPDKLKTSHPGYEIKVTQNGVEVKGPTQDEAEKLKSKLLEFLSGVSQVHVPVSALKANFLQRQDVRDKLRDQLKDQGLPSTYTVTGGVLILSSASMQMVNRACEVIKGAVSESVLPVEPEHECMIYSEEWRNFLLNQHACSAEVSAEGNAVSVVTLTDVEQEVKENIVRFLSTPIQKEVVISMQPAMLTYIQLHHQQLLMDMAEVIIFPLDTGDGLSDIFALAWKMMSSQNFARSSSARGLTARQADALAEDDNATSARIEEAKKILSQLESDRSHMAAEEELEEELDLYSDTLPSGEQLETQESNRAENQLGDLQSLDEDAYLSLAIQLSMEASQNPDRQAEEDLQKVLQLSKDEAAAVDESQMLVKAVDMSLQEAIRAANTAQIEVFASYTHDLVRVDIALGKKVGLRQCEETLQHKSFRKLSAFHRRCLDLIKRKHSVEIQIQGTTAVVSGFKDHVAGALPDLNALLEKAAGSTTDAEILKTVQWVWHDRERSAATPYPPEATVFIENAWRMKQDKLDILFNSQPYTIDFAKMLEFSVSSGRSVPISRKLVSSVDLYTEFQDDYSLLSDVPDAVRLEKDSEEYNEVAAEFYNGLSEQNKVQIIKVNQLALLSYDYSLLSDVPDAVRLEKDSEEYNEVAAEFYNGLSEQNKVQIIKVEKLMNRLLYSQYRLKKADMEQKVRGDVERTLYHGTSESSVKEICIHGFNRSFCGKNDDYSLLSDVPDAVRLEKDSEEYNEVAAEFYNGLSEQNKVQIIKVEKLMNRLLYSQYRLKKADMEQKVRGDVERTLYHGTSESSVKEICIHGFNRSFCGKNATAFGQGVYFAVKSSYSLSDTYSPPNADGHKFIFVARVLTGDFTQGKHDMRAAPLREGSGMPMRFHSVVDNVKEPSLFVIFNDTQAYPQYLITCLKAPE
ncbi:hypothetical protein PGIGA_G00138000 [Pangasianodon gigas]|uniref:Uncharacterized protein n=1 Tax=Pangasianodon gigas TaxID=30993 RepID=A0ACC5XKY0_PANGG|nr:hypothetical protein [Pangasianodon gigas]